VPFMSNFGKQLISYFVIFAALFKSQTSALDHTENGTDYGNDGVHLYTQMKHSSDGALFLDPYFTPYLHNLEGQVLLDAGCGAGPWAILAAQGGATVYGVDLQEGMIANAKEAAREAKVDNIYFEVGDASRLPYPDNLFDRAISINVGCNLPVLQPHLKELFRVLKPGGLAVITSPNSFAAVFTDGKLPQKEIVRAIRQLLIDQQASFPQIMLGKKNLYRASFVKVNGEWTLLQNEADIKYGEPIIRRLPLMMIPNYYHPKAEYLDLFAKVGFLIREVHTPHFANDQERLDYNTGTGSNFTLGKEYVDSPPYMIFIVEKL
jgi:ubiquinone/menaquinone biosynthesis C-methylase UbiE